MSQHKCKKCNPVLEFSNYYQYQKHKIQAHGWVKTPRNKINEIKTSSAFDRILDAKKAIKEALADLDVGRNQCHQRLLDLDNMIAKYKALI